MATRNQADVGLSGSSGTGSFAGTTSPSFTTPTLGVASATSINKVALTAPATSSTLTIADGKTLTCNNTLTFTGTDSSSVAFGAGGTVLYAAGSGGLKSFQVFTSGSAATYTRPAGITSILVECVGGGGGGGGVTATASNVAAAGGGASGAYSRKFYSSAASSYTYTVGGGGNGGAAGNNSGSTGSSTTFDSITAIGGLGGAFSTASSTQCNIGGAGQLSTGGDFNGFGCPGSTGISTLVSCASGSGGSSIFGGGALGVANSTLTTSTAGSNASNYGGGGSGAVSFTGTVNRAGGNGNAGIIIVWEFA